MNLGWLLWLWKSYPKTKDLRKDSPTGSKKASSALEAAKIGSLPARNLLENLLTNQIEAWANKSYVVLTIGGAWISNY